MKLGGAIGYRNNTGFSIIPILNGINPIPRIDIYFFKIYSNIDFPSTCKLLSPEESSFQVIWGGGK